MPGMRHESPTFSPLYRQIKSLMLQALEGGQWRPGEVIPSESELANRYNVSQGTVRKAVDELAADNLLIRRQGKGTFVASHSDPRSFFRFLRLAPLAGEMGASRSVPLECWRAKAGPEVARVLQLKLADPIIIVRRLLEFAQQPVILDEIYLPGDAFGGLSLDELRDWQSSLYALFETRYGVRMVRAEERLRAVAADRQNAEVLKVAEGSPLLSVERVSYSYGDRPMEWRLGQYSTANHAYVNILN
jgi:GntR family transcriptional regulator